MSFSSQLKKEICRNKSFIRQHREAVCLGLVLFGRRFGEESILLHTESQTVARLYSELLYELVEINTSITMTEQILGDSRKLFAVTVDAAEDRLAVVRYIGRARLRFESCQPKIEGQFEYLHGVLCGAFLSSANISDPQKSYHLEFVIHSTAALEAISALLDRLGMKYRLTERKGTRLVYMKSSEEIEDVLTMLGAGKSALEVMNVKIYKNLRNKANRVTNCETANIDRTVTAAAAVAARIRWIDQTVGVGALPENLREIAELRLGRPDLPLSELAQMLSPPISRSGAHYRLRQIMRFADSLAGKDGEG